MQHFFSQLAAFERDGQPFALCTVIDAGGSTPGRVSFHMAVLPDGRSFGTVGGGKLEHLCTEAALEVLRKGHARIVEYHLDKSAQGIGMACGGTVRVFIENVAAR
ncbi:MAG: XdhC family protein, partial [Myxococcota bacterium]|nr:XdhC family protein [Myxococcota bacterium]